MALIVINAGAVSRDPIDKGASNTSINWGEDQRNSMDFLKGTEKNGKLHGMATE